jgi:transcriptional regulator with XRE-family HTH domain
MAANYRLKAARVLKGLTQLQLAEKIGMTEHDVSRLETGRVQARRAIKERVAAVLEKPAFELFDC